MSISLAVVIATKNRSEAIERYAFASLERSTFRDFVCVVWDASDGDATQTLCEGRRWSFPLEYRRAPRSGLASQRNDALEFVMEQYPTALALVFIDDDSELSPDALEGVSRSFFEEEDVWGVNVPHVPFIGAKDMASLAPRRVTSYLHNRSACPEPFAVEVEWLSGCSMAYRKDSFGELGLRFPEAFQRFGGYALGEDVALSFYLHKKMGKKLINAKSGALCHHAAGGSRLNVANMAASKWHNFHLLFACLYEDVKGPKLCWLTFKFKLFMIAAALKLLIRARSLDFISLFRGVGAARKALRESDAKRTCHNLTRSPFVFGKGSRSSKTCAVDGSEAH